MRPSPFATPPYHEIADHLPALLIQADRVAETVSQGVHGRRKRGSGDSFWQFRPYSPGEPSRRIDWRQSAKTDQHYVREYEWEASQTVWMWRDGSNSMNWSSSKSLPTKLERAELLCLALGSLLLRGNEQIALLGSDSSPSRNRQSLERFAHAFLKERRKGEHSDSLPQHEHLPRFGEMVLMGDFLSPMADIEASLKNYSRRHIRGHLLQVLDPFEESLPYQGRTIFEGLEGEPPLFLGNVDAVRKAYHARLQERNDRLIRLAHSLGWTFQRHRTDHPAQGALLALYQSMSQNVRGM